MVGEAEAAMVGAVAVVVEEVSTVVAVVAAFKAPAATVSLEAVAAPGGVTQVGTGGDIPTTTPTHFRIRPSLPHTTRGNKRLAHRVHLLNSSTP